MTDTTTSDSENAREPFLRVVSGNPTEEELAALVTVLAAASSQRNDTSHRPTSTWAAKHTIMRRPLHVGPGAWRSSSWAQ